MKQRMREMTPSLSSLRSYFFADFVKRCCEKNVEKRWSVNQLMDVSVIPMI